MKNNSNLTLIEEEISCEDANEILTKMFFSNLNFHNIKNWSSQERYGTDDEIAQERIPALKREMEKLQTILSEARVNRKKLVVSSSIKITLVDG